MKWLLILLCLVAVYAGFVRKYREPTPTTPTEPETAATLPELDQPYVTPHPPEPRGTIVEGEAGYKYLCYLPAGYDAQSEKWPLIIFLHGACRDENLSKLKHFGPIQFASSHPNFPCIALAPATARGWSLSGFNQLWIGIGARFPNIDWSRVYLTGYSMGGHATWMLAAAYPGRFAAIAPVAGAGDARQIATLRQVPAWVFHGANDRVVPVAYSYNMIQALQRAGGEVKSTIYARCGHESWQPAYRTAELYDWFLQHQR